MTLDSLTERQREVYLYIRRKILSQQPPSVREIAARFGMQSPNAVVDHLKMLERKGFITRTPRVYRGIQLANVE